jgi:hypothetical protein
MVTREMRTGFWAGEPNGKRPVGRIMWEDNIKVNLGEIEWACGVDSSGSGKRSVIQ